VRIAAAASTEHLRAGRAIHRAGSHGVARQRPPSERSASLPGPARDVARLAPAPDAAATPSTFSPGLDLELSGDGGASGASAGLLFGGAFALLVAGLLPAAPRMRRRLFELPAVCRPAAFLVVLERPG
jgi:hypothetical protein